MNYVATKSKDCPDNSEWRAEAVGSDGECYVTIFCGPEAERRAKAYVRWQNRALKIAEKIKRSKALVTALLLALICGCSQPAPKPAGPDLADQLADAQQRQREEQANLPKRRPPVPPMPYFTPDQIIDIR